MINGINTEVIPLSELVSHNGLDLDEVIDKISFNGNICHLYVINEALDKELDADGRDDTVLVNLWE